MLLSSRFSATFGLSPVFSVADRRCCFDSLEADRVVLAIDWLFLVSLGLVGLRFPFDLPFLGILRGLRGVSPI